MGRTVDVRIYPDACTAGRGVVAVALFSKQETEFSALLKNAAEGAVAGILVETNEISGSGMFEMVAAVVASGGQLRGGLE